jgi:UDP-glucose 6-dehydrogenase
MNAMTTKKKSPRKASKKPQIGFIGQGWIGKAYADNFEERGYDVVRYALEKPYIKNKDQIKDCDIVFIAVWTPTTPKGFDISVVESVLPLIGERKIAVLKSTIPPGTTEALKKKFPKITLLYSPEFLNVSSHIHDATHPFANIVGMAHPDAKHYLAAERVMKTLPKAPYASICKSSEAETFKYAHNTAGYAQILVYNAMYDMAQQFGAEWDVVQKALEADPMVSNWYIKPVHKGGRGAGGTCFIKDIAALRSHFEKHLPHDKLVIDMLSAMEAKNIELLTSTRKNLDLLKDVYGPRILKQTRENRTKKVKTVRK